MEKLQVGVIGATGMVGQRFVSQLAGHPWFSVQVLAASPNSAGKRYDQAVAGRWAMPGPIPERLAGGIVLDAARDCEQIARGCDLVFSAVNMAKEQTAALEERYARLECPVVSNNSAHRQTRDVPMIVPEINHAHTALIAGQRRRLGVARGFIAVKPNCSLQCYMLPLDALRALGPTRVLACTYQAVSGAGRTLDTWPQMQGNLIPYIAGEEQKSEQEPLKIWGSVRDGAVVPLEGLDITTQCVRVPVDDGHMAAVFAAFEQKAEPDEMARLMEGYRSLPQRLDLPSAPRAPIHVFYEPDRPQTRLDRDLEGGMAVSVGRLRKDSQFDVKFIALSHNTVRGAAGGAILLAELLYAQGYLRPQHG